MPTSLAASTSAPRRTAGAGDCRSSEIESLRQHNGSWAGVTKIGYQLLVGSGCNSCGGLIIN